MSAEGVSRRRFLQGSGTLASTAALRLSMPTAFAAAQAACSARDEGVALSTLGAAEALELEAIAARILPTTDTPGAREAGVIHFFDNVLADLMADMLAPLRGGLAGFQDGIDGGSFAALTESEQDARLTAQQDTPFFGMVRTLTLFGFFAMAKYGGNRDNVGWKLIGFAGHGAAQPPFGFYDAQYRGLPFDESAPLTVASHGAREGGHHGE